MGLIEIPVQTLIILMGVSVLIVLLMIRALMLKYRADPYQFDVITMKPGVNKHERVTGSQLEFTHTDDTTDYKIKSERLYRVKVGKFTGLLFRMRGIRQRFLVGYQHNQTDPIAPPDEIKVSARVLKEVNESRALDRALAGEFNLPMDPKKILILMGFVVIVAIAYLMITGGIVI